MNITEVKIELNSVDIKALSPYIELMKKNGVKDPVSLLPTTKWQRASFKLSKTYSGMANAVRRVLMEEMLVTCLDFENQTLTTDDDFILADVLLKNINLLPVEQTPTDYSSKVISLYRYNETNNIIDVKASDIIITKGLSNNKVNNTNLVDSKNKRVRKTTKGSSDNFPIDKLIPNSNITIAYLRPGKFIKLDEITLMHGYGKDDAGRFSLIDNITYEILNIEPYDIYKQTGQRSIEYDPDEFRLSFTTSGNVTVKQVAGLLSDTLLKKINNAKERLLEYKKTDQSIKYYYAEGCEVTIQDDIYSYKFDGEYVTLSNMLAQRCYILDNTILFCVPAIDRYDNEIAYIRLKHADPTKLLIEACDACITDVKALVAALVK
jgi:hypothetical protein